MRIAGGPRLAIPRAGRIPRSAWVRQQWEGAHSYEALLAKRRALIRAIISMPAGDRKRAVTYVQSLRGGEDYRLVDSHGRAYGKRHAAPGGFEGGRGRARRVAKQEEDYHSLLSRMTKRVHREMVRD